MKLPQAENTIERSNSFEESSYSIKASPKVFNILSDTLYSNKVLAVVRELSTNALDSHIENGNPDEPFLINIPTVANPTFSVRDYGTGLSSKDCMKLYTTYFESSRDDSNDAVGCMGLGSKSPFAYADSFTVESFYYGVHYIFNAYKDENGYPKLALMSENKTDERNGMRISLAVEADDFWRFRDESERLFRHWNTVPTFTGSDVEIEKQEVLFKGNGWRVLKGTGKAHCVMGNIRYPLDASSCGVEYDHKYRAIFLRANIEIDFNIGDVSVTPSREALAYDTATIDKVLAKMGYVLLDYVECIEKQFDDCDNIWDARALFTAMNDQKSHTLYQLTKSVSLEDLLFNDEKLFENERLEVELDIEGLDLRRYYQYRSSVKFDSNCGVRISSDDCTYVFDDLKTGTIGRVKCLTQDLSTKQNVYLIRGTEEAIKEFKDVLSMPESACILSSSLPKPTVNNYGDKKYVTRTKIALLKDSFRYAHLARDCWNDCDVDLEQGGVYLPIDKYEVPHAGYNQHDCNRHPSSALEVINYLKHFGVEVEVHGIKIRTLKTKKFAKCSGSWENFWDFAKRKFLEILEDSRHLYNLSVRDGVNNTFNDLDVRHRFLAVGRLPYMNSSLINSVRSIVSRYDDKDAEKINQLKYRLISMFDCVEDSGIVSLQVGGTNINASKMLEKVMERYPMLTTPNIDCYGAQGYIFLPEETDKVKEYVELIEKVKV